MEDCDATGITGITVGSSSDAPQVLRRKQKTHDSDANTRSQSPTVCTSVATKAGYWRVKMLMLAMITSLRIVANFYFGWPVTRYECSVTIDRACHCNNRRGCGNPENYPGGDWCYVETDCQGTDWGFCRLLPLKNCSHSRGSTMTGMADVLVTHSPDDLLYYDYVFDFTFLVDYFVRPLLSALGVYMLLRRLDRFLAKSQLHVWSCRSVLWLFLTSTLMDDSITEALNQFSWAATGSGSAGGGWSPVHWILFSIGSCVSLLLQVVIANLKLMSLSWKRLAVCATLLAAAIVIAVVVTCVHTLLYVICFSDYFAKTVFDVFPSLTFEICSPFQETVERWALACISLLCIVGPVQSFGMWRAAFKAVHDFDWEELRWEIRFLCASSFCTMIGTPFTAGLLAYFVQVFFPTRVFQLMWTLDLSFQILNSLILGGLVGPEKWGKPLDMFKELGLSNGGLMAKRIAFPGKINLSADDCIVSFPGIYSEEWDTAVAVASDQQTHSLACVFLTDVASGLGQHVADPDSPGNCYCKALYGTVPVEAYLSEVDMNNETASSQQQLAFKRADAKAMGQLLLIRHSHTTLLEWKEKKAAARSKAKKLWKKNQGRAPWGCAWFHVWKENVDRAVERNQSLHVFYFEGRVGAGKVNWDELADEGARKNAREGGGLGNSQTAEVAYLDKLGLAYVEHDVMDFKSFIQSSSVAIPDEGETAKCEVVMPI